MKSVFRSCLAYLVSLDFLPFFPVEGIKGGKGDTPRETAVPCFLAPDDGTLNVTKVFRIRFFFVRYGGGPRVEGRLTGLVLLFGVVLL